MNVIQAIKRVIYSFLCFFNEKIAVFYYFYEFNKEKNFFMEIFALFMPQAVNLCLITRFG